MPLFWDYVGYIADILGIISFIASVCSVVYTRTILRKINASKLRYESQRENLLIMFEAMQRELWLDNNRCSYTALKLNELFLEYKLKFWSISSLLCKYHVRHALQLLKKPHSKINYFLLKPDVAFIVARLRKED